MSDLNLDQYERIICYNSLFDSTYLATIIDHVQPQYFKDKNIATVFTIISAFYNKREKLPTLTEVRTYLNTDELRNSFKTLIQSLQDIDKNLDKDELYENTERFLKEKSVYNTMMSIAEDIAKGNVDTSKALDKFEKACNISLVTDRGISVVDSIDEIIDDLNRVKKTIPSMWPWLDEALDGGFLENGRALYLFAGETNIGKSIFLGNIATNIAKQGKNVLLITLEMSEMLYARRLCSNVSQVPMKELVNNSYSLKEAMAELKCKNGNIFIKEFPPSTITPNQLKAFIKKIVDTGVRIDAVVLDYVSLLHSPVGSNSYERGKYVAEQLRAMTYTFSCPFISAVQLNRQGTNVENPDMTTISESLGTGMTADVLITIYQNAEDRELGIIRLGMPKNRYGPRGMTQPMRIDYATLTVTQSDDDIGCDEDDNSSFNALRVFSN